MTDHREQNSSCPRHRQEIPRDFLTKWEATPLKPTEDAMQNDEAERLARDCKTAAKCLKYEGSFETGQAILTEAAALIRTQTERIAELEASLALLTFTACTPTAAEWPEGRGAEPERGSDDWKAWNAIRRMSPGPDRARLRSRTFPGIATACARQWGGLATTEQEAMNG